MIIVNKCGEKYCSNEHYQTQIEECRAAAPKGWNGLCPFQNGYPLKDFSVPNPNEGAMVTKAEFIQYLETIGFTPCNWDGGADVWHIDKLDIWVPLNAIGVERMHKGPELNQCANDMVDLEEFKMIIATAEEQMHIDTLFSMW